MLTNKLKLRGIWKPALFGLVLSLGLPTSCSLPSASRVEVWRQPAPGGLNDALVVQVNEGAMSDYVYEVYVVRDRQRFDSTSACEVAAIGSARDVASKPGLSLKWLDATHLRVAYSDGSVEHFVNDAETSPDTTAPPIKIYLDDISQPGGAAFSR